MNKKDVLIGVRPWNARGPGWSNAGIEVEIYLENGKKESKTIYCTDFSQREWLAWEAAIGAYNVLEREIARERGWRLPD